MLANYSKTIKQILELIEDPEAAINIAKGYMIRVLVESGNISDAIEEVNRMFEEELEDALNEEVAEVSAPKSPYAGYTELYQ